MKITVAKTPADMKLVEAILADCKSAPEEVVVVPSDTPGDLRWQVVDNRGHEGFCEGFDTIDGALSYALDIHTTPEHQSEWDLHGHLHGELMAIVRAQKPRRDPGRIAQSMCEGDDRDELVDALADNVVADPAGVNRVSVGADCTVVAEFNNTVGHTGHVDGILETMNMRDWRVFCDKLLAKALDAVGRNADAYDWPTPRPEVTKIPEDDGTDVVATVRVRWRVDRKTWLAMKTFVEWKNARREETCPHCDAVVAYVREEGKTVATCPECGAVVPLCGECVRPEKVADRCADCGLCRKCDEINRLRVRRNKEER